MPVNLDKPPRWKTDIIRSVDMYNDWFMKFAPRAFRSTRIQTTKDVEAALHATDNLTNIQPALMRKHPEILPTLRMSTCPPLAVDRLIGLARTSRNLVHSMELEARGYKRLAGRDDAPFDAMPRGTFTTRTNVLVKLQGGVQAVNIPVDVIIMPKKAKARDLPVFFEAKSAGDFTNTNKRRKEEAMKNGATPCQLRQKRPL